MKIKILMTTAMVFLGNITWSYAASPTVVMDGWNKSYEGDSHINALSDEEKHCGERIKKVIFEAAKTNPALRASLNKPGFLVQLDINHTEDAGLFSDLVHMNNNYVLDGHHLYIRVAQLESNQYNACDPGSDALHTLHPNDFDQWQNAQMAEVYKTLNEAYGPHNPQRASNPRSSSISITDLVAIEAAEQQQSDLSIEPVHHHTGFFK